MYLSDKSFERYNISEKYLHSTDIFCSFSTWGHHLVSPWGKKFVVQLLRAPLLLSETHTHTQTYNTTSGWKFKDVGTTNSFINLREAADLNKDYSKNTEDQTKCAYRRTQTQSCSFPAHIPKGIPFSTISNSDAYTLIKQH